MKLNTFEVVGIGVSIAVMALALWLVRVENTNTIVAQLGSQSAAVIVADGENERANLTEAFATASNGGRTIERLVIDDVRIGTGVAVEDGDTVSVHYIGTLQDGTQFDNSYTRGKPFSFTVGAGRVIAGWEQGLVGMQVGGQRILVIPSELGYGSRAGGPIPPNSTLVFAVELLEIN